MDNDLDELTSLLDTFDTPDCEDKDETLAIPTNHDTLSSSKKETSVIHTGDTDSSDDEDNKYAAEQKYTDLGRSIKKSLNKPKEVSSFYSQNHSWKAKQSPNTLQKTPAKIDKSLPKDIYSDPFFGIRIITPLISSQTFKERMAGKVAVTMNKLEKHLQTQDKATDWVVAGVIVSKYIKTSQKGNQFACWTISDLREGLKTASVFLFGKAYKDLWKTNTHVVVAILNPSPLENRKGSGDIAALSVLNSDQVMLWGQSKDLGFCKALKKNGEPCTSFVNRNQCEYCVYHVKQEYKKFSGRSELQASWGGGLNQLRNKVLGKNEVFYGGKSFTAVVAKPTKKQKTKDQARLSQLFNKCESRLGFDTNNDTKKSTQRTIPNRVQQLRDAQRLQSLTGSPATLSSLELGPDKEEMRETKCNDSKITKKNDTPSSLKSEASISNKSPIVIPGLKARVEAAVKKSQIKITPSQTSIPKTPEIKVEKSKYLSNSTSVDKSKNKPTKNRFDNLVKLKSKSSVTSSSTTNKASQEKAMSESTPVDLLDVSFEFDEIDDFILSKKLDEVENDLKKEELKISNLNKSKRISLVKNSVQDIKNLDNVRKVSSAPLNERKLHTNNVSVMGTNDKIEKSNEKKPNLMSLSQADAPKLSQFSCMSLNVPLRQSKAKEKALKYIKINGPINKEEPTKTKRSEELALERKRKLREGEESIQDDKVTMSQRFLELMNTSSKHLDLISNAENEALDEYYDKMEKKEKMEEKMLNTFKVDCKAFKCLQCKYKWFSPSELCKAEKHPIKMISAVKRFFQCQHCKNRTVSLEVFPLHNCSNCGSASWLRAAMMRERKSSSVHLSIRGGEQKFTNSVVTDTNLDLLVPDDT